jgi:hypothetical protein
MLLWNYVVQHSIEIVVAVVLALVFALIMDFLQPASRLGAAVRHYKNWHSERSMAALRERIARQERYRNTVASFLASDKSLYLVTLQYIIAMLLLMCMAAAIVIVGQLMQRLAPSPDSGLRVVGLLPLVLAGVLGVYGLRTASWDTHARVSDVVAELDKEIGEMKAKLEAKTD